MKSLNKLFMSLAAVAVVLFFAQCAGNAPAPAASEAAASAGTLSGLKVAYVDVDTLLAKYNFCVDLNEAMIKKSENVRATLNQKSRELETQQSEFENKYQNNAFASQERARRTKSVIALAVVVAILAIAAICVFQLLISNFGM